jgi:hypothetical protein
MKMLYKYPQAEFPYQRLIEENARRGRDLPEFELFDTGVFDEDRYFDIMIEYAKAAPEDIIVRVTIRNMGPEAAVVQFLPHVWFRNTWSWGRDSHKPIMKAIADDTLQIEHHGLGKRFWMYFEGGPELLFCENETNIKRLYGKDTGGRFCKDGINDFIVNQTPTVNPERQGTKAAARYRVTVPARGSVSFHARLSDKLLDSPFRDADKVFLARLKEADEFYDRIQSGMKNEDERSIQRQAFAGMLWAKQFYYFDVGQWLTGDPGHLHLPPAHRRKKLRMDPSQ